MPYPKRVGYIGLAKQASKGTGVEPAKFVRWEGGTKMTPVQQFTPYREGGDGYYPGVTLKESHAPDGQFALLARPDLAAYLFAMLLGADSVAGASAPYTHTITPHADTIPWVTIERSIAGQIIERIVDCKIKSIVVEGEAGKPIKLTVDFVGITPSIGGSAASASYETDMPFVFYQATLTLDGGAVTTINKFKITVSNILDEQDFTNAITRADIPLLGRDVSLEFEMVMEATTQYAAVYYGGATAVATAIDEGSFIVDLQYGSAAALRELKIEVPALYHTEAPVELDTADDKQVYSCKAHAKKASASELITVTVKNAESSDLA